MAMTPELLLGARIGGRVVEFVARGCRPDDGTAEGEWLARIE
ncbi:hypothetical protein [Streptomyces durbertensis]|nr:hypothetical protein [Streptomyces durbertensis]